MLICQNVIAFFKTARIGIGYFKVDIVLFFEQRNGVIIITKFNRAEPNDSGVPNIDRNALERSVHTVPLHDL